MDREIDSLEVELNNYKIINQIANEIIEKDSPILTNSRTARRIFVLLIS